MKILIVKDIVGPYCGTYDDGVKLFRAIYPLVKASHTVMLDFQGIGVTSSSFFSGAILNLSTEFADDHGGLPIDYCNLPPRDKFILTHTLKAAKATPA